MWPAHEKVFATFTYKEEKLPWDLGLHHEHWQKFIRALRDYEFNKALASSRPARAISYFMCGEYGGLFKRPHYHACIFGAVDFMDRKDMGDTWTSPTLEKIWGNGIVRCGDINMTTARYCAAYVIKRTNGKMAEEVNPETGLKRYERFHSQTGEIVEVKPEYAKMSLRPAIGKRWYERYGIDEMKKNGLVENGREWKIPKYFWEKFKETHPEDAEVLAYDRLKKGNRKERTPERLAVRERVHKAKIQFNEER